MANRNLFQTVRGVFTPRTDARNDAAAPAYARSDKAALAQLAATGCLNATFYATAETQLDRALELARTVDVDFLARTALYARHRGLMKDMPALLCTVLATRSLDRFIEIFPQVIDNGRMLRTFVQIVRSGVTGRKSLGSAPKRLIRQWLERATERQLLDASIGTSPSPGAGPSAPWPQAPTSARTSPSSKPSSRWNSAPRKRSAARAGSSAGKCEFHRSAGASS